jgi:hypothetical protein
MDEVASTLVTESGVMLPPSDTGLNALPFFISEHTDTFSALHATSASVPDFTREGDAVIKGAGDAAVICLVQGLTPVDDVHCT